MLAAGHTALGRVVAGCSPRVGGCSSGKGTRCCGRWPTSAPDGLLVVDYPYFERPEPTVWDEGGTYVETDAVFAHNVTHEWNHGLGEIVTALLEQGLRITGLVEHDSVPWEALPGLMERLPAASGGSRTGHGGCRTATR